jgi:hypothetical protein
VLLLLQKISNCFCFQETIDQFFIISDDGRQRWRRSEEKENGKGRTKSMTEVEATN